MSSLTSSLARAIADYQGWPADWELTPDHHELAGVMFSWTERVLWPSGSQHPLTAGTAEGHAVATYAEEDEVAPELWRDRDFDEDADYLTEETPGFFTEANPSDQRVVIGTDAASGSDVIVDFQTNPHLLIAGIAGSGKTDLVRTIIVDSLAAGSDLRVIDSRGGSDYAAFAGQIAPIATAPADALRVIESVWDEMNGRLLRLETASVATNAELPEPGQASLLIVDDFPILIDREMVPPPGRLGHNGQTWAQVEKVNAAKERILELLADIARRGRSADVHLIIITQMVAGRVLRNFGSDALSNFGRILLGPSSYIERIATLRGGKEIEPPEHDGRHGFGLHEPVDGPATAFESRHIDDAPRTGDVAEDHSRDTDATHS